MKLIALLGILTAMVGISASISWDEPGLAGLSLVLAMGCGLYLVWRA